MTMPKLRKPASLAAPVWVTCALCVLVSSAALALPTRAGFIADWLRSYPSREAPKATAQQKAFLARLAKAAKAEPQVRYDPSYTKLAYPNGDAPAGHGVCTDVVVRAYKAMGVDLQALVHEDMEAKFSAYPNLWSRTGPDANIDHRRVPNLLVFFGRRGALLPLTRDPADFLPGDVVAWDLGGGLTHVGVVSDESSGGRPLVIHHMSELGPTHEDVLFSWPLIGHARFVP